MSAVHWGARGHREPALARQAGEIPRPGCDPRSAAHDTTSRTFRAMRPAGTLQEREAFRLIVEPTLQFPEGEGIAAGFHGFTSCNSRIARLTARFSGCVDPRLARSAFASLRNAASALEFQHSFSVERFVVLLDSGVQIADGLTSFLAFQMRSQMLAWHSLCVLVDIQGHLSFGQFAIIPRNRLREVEPLC
jgi:hypothetical protein